MGSHMLEDEECIAQLEHTGTARRTGCGASSTKEGTTKALMWSSASFGSRYDLGATKCVQRYNGHQGCNPHRARAYGISPSNTSSANSGNSSLYISDHCDVRKSHGVIWTLVF